LRFFFSHARRCKSCASPLAGQSSGRVASRRAPALKPSHGGRSGTAFGHPVCRGRVTAAQSQSQGRELWTRNRGRAIVDSVTWQCSKNLRNRAEAPPSGDRSGCSESDIGGASGIPQRRQRWQRERRQSRSPQQH
jgi:hypothetical protein